METIIQILARELEQTEQHVENVVALLDEGNTIPFIARYRKELHGSMDDTSLRTLEERLQYLRSLEKRREEVKGAIEGQGKLTEELSAAIDNAATLAEVEDLYRPYKQKRRTRATAAREKGLEPLAALLYAQKPDCPDPLEAAAGYVDPEKGVETAEDALQGASDIIAEDISDDAAVRKALRAFMQRRSELTASAAKEEDSVYRLYYDFRQSVNRLQGHQVLAINRGEREEFLKVGVETNRDEALILLRRAVVRPGTKAAEFINFCDAFDIPVLSLTNVKGFAATKCSEKRMAKAVGKLTYAFANATVPKVNVIIGKAYGSAYVAMNSKAIGADITIAWPNAEIGMMDASLAAKIICDGQGSDAIDACAKEYAALQNSVTSAAKRGYVDQIVDPADTRKYVIGAFEMLATKSEGRPEKKHGTV